MQDHILKASCRFNINNPQHKKVYDVLMNLDPSISKSKSQFFMDAAEYYIDHFGREAFTEQRKEESPYVTRKDLEAIQQKMVDDAVTEARNEVIRLLGGMLCGARIVAPMAETTEEAPIIENEDDDTMADLATKWMV